MTKVRYLKVTTKVIAQTTSERMPRTFSGVGATPCLPPKLSLKA
jgi:hypothetical protein